MGMNLDAIKSKLASLQNQKQNTQKKDRTLTLWKPTIGKHTVRIVPAVWDRSNPFKEVLFHYDIGNRTMISLVNFNEKDPIVEFSKQLTLMGDKENWVMGKKLEPKMRVFAPVIVRGEEEKGVRLWEFGKQIYSELLSLADDPDVGDYTDVIEGRDFTIETTGPETNGTSFNQSKIRVKTKTSALSDSAAEVEKWMNNQPNPLAIYTKYSYDEMKETLLAWLHPETEESTDETTKQEATVAAPAKQTPATPASKVLSVSTPKKKASVDEEFDELFGN